MLSYALTGPGMCTASAALFLPPRVNIVADKLRIRYPVHPKPQIDPVVSARDVLNTEPDFDGGRGERGDGTDFRLTD